MSGRFALLIGNTEYSDPGLAQLAAPGKDAQDFSRVLSDREICGFDEVKLLLNQPEHVVRGAIDEFFDQKKPDDLLVLYFSGHGVRDELGSLYLAVKNTLRTRLRSTAIKSDYIREAMDQSRSRRQVLILDCCNSGAFEQGTKAATGGSVGTASAFEAGYGRIILTASDSTQYAWEGDKVIGQTDNSLFTHFLVQGLQGEADLDGDGQITVDELYDYAYENVKLATPKQTPSKFSSKQQGEIVLRQGIRIEDSRPIPLPAPLIESIENPFSDIRLGAVRQLTKLMNGKNLGLARAAKEALERIAESDDSREVSRAAAQVVGATHQTGRFTTLKETIVPPAPVRSTAEPTQPQSDESISISSRLAWMTLGWAIAGALSGILYDAFNQFVGGIAGGAMGGLITAVALRSVGTHSNRLSMIWITAAWTIGGTLGWTIGEALTDATGSMIGSLISASVSMAILLSTGQISFRWKSLAWIIASWSIGTGIGWSIAKTLMIDQLGIAYAISWALGTAIGWGIPGFVMGWQLLSNKDK